MTFASQKIKLIKLIQTASNPKMKAMYQKLLQDLIAKESSSPKEGDRRPGSEVKENPQHPSLTVPSGGTPASSKPMDAPTTVSDVPKEPNPQILGDEATSNSETGEPNQTLSEKPIFQAIGVISGNVLFGDDSSTLMISLAGKNYPLFYAARRSAWEALKLEIKNSGESHHRLVVYPKIIHFPESEKPAIIGFAVVKFNLGQPRKPSMISEFNDWEFRLCGLWQFIPVCRQPVISVMRNKTSHLVKQLENQSARRRALLLKAVHVPVFWKDAPVNPLRFNPKLDRKEQGKPPFVQVKARFLPGQDVFAFVEQLAEPTTKLPRFFKVSKKLKAMAQAEFKANEN